MYYAGAKFHVPWYGGNDFREYYQMALDPFDNDARSPFAYRIMLPTIANLVYRSGLFYEANNTPYKDSYISFDGIDYEPSVLSAIIFTNYIFLSLAAFFVYKSIDLKFSRYGINDNVMSVVLPSLIFLSLSTSVHGYAGLTEGGSLLIVSLLLVVVSLQSLLS